MDSSLEHMKNVTSFDSTSCTERVLHHFLAVSEWKPSVIARFCHDAVNQHLRTLPTCPNLVRFRMFFTCGKRSHSHQLEVERAQFVQKKQEVT